MILTERLRFMEDDREKLMKENAGMKLCVHEATRRSTTSVPTTATIDELMRELSRKQAEVDQLRVANTDGTVRELLRQLDECREQLKHGGQANSNESTTRVLHMADNPTTRAHAEHRDEVGALREENEWLKARCEALESLRTPAAGGEAGVIDGDATLVAQHTLSERDKDRQIGALRQEVAVARRQTDMAKQLSQQLSREYREMYARLTGYQLKMKGADGNMYEAQSVYDRGEGRCLLFQVKVISVWNNLEHAEDRRRLALAAEQRVHGGVDRLRRDVPNGGRFDPEFPVGDHAAAAPEGEGWR